MSRVGVLSFLHNGNYGSSLQAFALQQVIRKLGHECEHLDYRPDLAEKCRNLILCGNSPKLVLEGRRKQQVRAGQAGMQEKYRRIDEFYGRRMLLSPPCRNRRELAEVSRQYDVLMCGSDQIWNPVWMNPAYFLAFGDPEKRRIAYAPSLGIQRTPARRKQRRIRRMLSLFDAVSVREEEGARILVSVTGNRPPVLPDPVCLLSREEWETVMTRPGNHSAYFLCYFIGENPAYWDRVREIQKKTGLSPLVIPVTGEAYGQTEFELLDGAGPEEFLGAVDGAEMICTDSFHGLVFGTIFEKKADLLRRYREEDPESKNSRVDHFLREIRRGGLESMREEGIRWLEQQLAE